MSLHKNEFGQPVGFPLNEWQPCIHPPKRRLVGSHCIVEPIDVEKHGRSLFTANREAEDGRFWTYLPYGPFGEYADYETWLRNSCLGDDPQFYAINDSQSGRAVGIASYLRIQPAIGVIEVGHINFSPKLQGTTAATEAMFLMMKNVFDLGYRRYEWKCDAHNAPSMKAAQRLGFLPEGVFRQATMYKGRNRDTAWFGIVDKDWSELKAGFQSWLETSNFDENGKQIRPLTVRSTIK